MGIFGEIGLGALGEAAGQYFGGSGGRDIGKQIGSAVGKYVVPFQRGGMVPCECEMKMKKKMRKRMRKGGVAGADMMPEEMAMGGIVQGYGAPAHPDPLIGYMGLPRHFGDKNSLYFTSQ